MVWNDEVQDFVRMDAMRIGTHESYRSEVNKEGYHFRLPSSFPAFNTEDGADVTQGPSRTSGTAEPKVVPTKYLFGTQFALQAPLPPTIQRVIQCLSRSGKTLLLVPKSCFTNAISHGEFPTCRQEGRGSPRLHHPPRSGSCCATITPNSNPSRRHQKPTDSLFEGSSWTRRSQQCPVLLQPYIVKIPAIQRYSQQCMHQTPGVFRWLNIRGVIHLKAGEVLVTQLSIKHPESTSSHN